MQAIVLDDARTARVTLKRMLQDLGAWPVHEAADGPAALALLAREPEVDLVVVDATLLPTPAAEVVRTLHAAARERPTLRLVMVATEAEMPSARPLLDAGIQALLQRPLTPEALQQALARLGLVDA